jgi:hypothetical protein
MNKTQSSFEISAIINNDELPLTINKMGKRIKQICLNLVKIWNFELSKKERGSKFILHPNKMGVGMAKSVQRALGINLAQQFSSQDGFSASHTS